MGLLQEIWAKDKALVIAFVVAIIAIIWYVYSQSKGQGIGSATIPTSGTSQTPDASTEQLSTILGDLGKLTPVTNTLQPINTVTNNTMTIAAPPPPPAVPPPTTPPLLSGIGNDAARDAAIAAAEKKYVGPAQATALQQAIAGIQKQFPRSGATS